MAPRILSKLFRREEKDPDPPPRRTSPEAPGILDSTCITTDRQHRKQRRYKLPVPAEEQRQLELQRLASLNQPRNPQSQSAFFTKLPLEVRNLIYRELFGGKRVHIDYLWKLPSIFRPRPKEKELQKARWQWWHRLCQFSDEWVADRYEERCCSHADEYNDAVGLQWKSPPEGTKLRGVEMLRVCQMGYHESLRILYGTNVFVTGPGMDTPFIISRLLAPSYAALITAMDIEVKLIMSLTAPPDLPGNWAIVYPAFFHLLQHSFPNMRRLHLTMYFHPWDTSQRPVTDESLDEFLAPWESLGASRDWKELHFFVPEDWYELLKGRADKQRSWVLRVTGFQPMIPFSCF